MYGQSIQDIVRISEDNLTGTATTKAMGGAQSSTLFGEAVTINPAIGAKLQNSVFIFSSSIFNHKNKLSIYDSQQKTNGTNFNINNLSFIINSRGNSQIDAAIKEASINKENAKKIKHYAFGFTLNRTNNFKNNFKLDGINNTNSLTDHLGKLSLNEGITKQFINFDNVNSLAEMGFITYLTNPDSNNIYSKPLVKGGNIYQNYNYQSKGAVTDFGFSFSSEINEKLSIGTSVGLINYNVKATTTFDEEDTKNLHDYFDELVLQENLEIEGIGFNFKTGLIYSPKRWFNIALAYHSGNSLVLLQRYDATLETRLTNHPELLDLKSPTSIQEAKISTLESNFSTKTPPKTIIGFSFRDEKIGLLSFDLEHLNYANSSFTNIDTKNPNINYEVINNQIKTSLERTFNVKLGGQLNFKTKRFRAGVAQYNIGGNENTPKRTYLTLGYGIEDENYILGLAYVKKLSNSVFDVYNLQESTSTLNKEIGTTIVFNIGIKF